MSKNFLTIPIVCLALIFSARLCRADWTRFRGPNGDGHLPTCNVPLPWQPKDVSWQIQLPGKGNGSPIVVKDKIFLMSADPDSAERYVLAYDLKSGKELWRKSFQAQTHKLHARSSYASCTPCANDNSVFVAWATPASFVVCAFSHAGDVQWQKDLGTYVSGHGFGASPMLVDDKLIIANSQDAEELPPGVEPGKSSILALNSTSGQVIWETPRISRRTSYGTPAILKEESGRKVLLFAETGDGMFALDADTGKALWNNQVFTKRCVSCPVIANGLVIGTEGSGGGGNILFAIDLKGEHKVIFDVRRSAPYVPTPVVKGDLLFLWADNGIVSCVSMSTGEAMWSNRIGGNVSSSPVIAGDKLVGIAEDGTVTVLAAGPDFQQLGTVNLPETTRSTPLLSENYVLIRTDSQLLCIGKP